MDFVPGSSVYKTAFVAKLPPASTSFLKLLSLSITFCLSSSVILGATTICATSTSAPKTGKSPSGIVLKNVRTSSGVISTLSTILRCISDANFPSFKISKK